MTFNQHDPVWTTFILEPDSLSTEQRHELEQELATNAACRQFVEELRVAAGVLKSELQAEMQPTAGAKETLAVVGKTAVTPRTKTRFSVWVRIAAGSLAGALLIGVVVNRVLVGLATSQLAEVKTAQKRALYKFRASEMRLGVELETPQHAASELRSITQESAESLSLDSGFYDSASFGDRLRASTERVKRGDGSAQENGGTYDAIAGLAPSPERKYRIENFSGGSRSVTEFDEAGIQEEVREKQHAPSAVARNDQIAHRRPRSPFSISGSRELDIAKTPTTQPASRGNESEESIVSNPRSLATIYNAAPSNTESYPALPENPFIKPEGLAALSTFSIDVDTASYSNVRRFLQHATQPPPGAVRLEEMINYFRYDYAPPKDDKPFAVHVEMAQCPWEPKHRLARVALKGKVIDQDKRPASNLVFLLDVSGSMDQPNKLPLVKRSLQLLVEQLTENDRVAIAVYAGSSGLVLDSTPGNNKQIILNAIENLQPSGSTNGAAGIKVAYEAAVKGFIPKATNRVILCTDGDFNVGVSSDDELVDLITEKAKTGVFLSVLGFGMGNYKDAKMMGLADKGNGNYAYIDNVREANKVLVEQMSGTLVTIAKDVKIQVEFNPQKVAAYRLIGYEKRMLAAQDFKDDKKDAGEIGAGHTVTAFYEIVPAGEANPAEKIDPLEFQPDKTKPKTAELPAELAELAMRVKLRYKQPDGDTSVEFSVGVSDETKPFAAGSKDFQFAAAVAGFGRVLRANEQQAKMTLDAIQEIAASAKGEDPSGYRAEFVDLVTKAKQLPALRKTDAPK